MWVLNTSDGAESESTARSNESSYAAHLIAMKKAYLMIMQCNTRPRKAHTQIKLLQTQVTQDHIKEMNQLINLRNYIFAFNRTRLV